MCGIAGYWNYRSGAPATPRILRAMAGTLKHRGPDEAESWLEGDLALGIQRLQVIDPEGGHQPMSNESGDLRLVFNGEIYGHADLRRHLQGRGHRFRSVSDTEVIVHAYEEWGEACVERFNGMFAFALWDRPRQRLLLARDRLGIKPLYIHEGPEGIVFGSELKAVLSAPWVPFEWDLEALDSFLTYEYVPGSSSAVAGIRKLPPGTLVVYSREGTPSRTRYWTLRRGDPPADPDRAAVHLRELLSDAVATRLVADVPVGVFLSGGIDSSTIVGLAAERSASPVETFTIGFTDRSYDERVHARRTAERFGTSHHERRVDPAVVELAPRLASYFDEPFADVSAFPTYLVSSHARESVTVALAGDGGDELFAGYDQYRADRWARRLTRLVGVRPWLSLDRLLEHVPPGPAKKGPINFAKRFAEGLRHPEDLEHARWWIFMGPEQRRALLSPAFAAAVAGSDPLEHYRERLREAVDHGFVGLNRQLYADVTGYLPDDILTKVDRMSMAVSLEARVPFLDHRVVEFAMSLPEEWKLRGGEAKWILKRAVRDLLPRSTRARRKQGFSMPMKNWLRGNLREMLHEMTAADRLHRRGWFEPAEVQRLAREHVAGRANHAHRLWSLIALELSADHLTEVANRRPHPTREVSV